MGSMKISEGTKGVFVIAATPFTERGELDLDSTDRLVDFYLSSGVAGITILGMMGEASKLTVDETSRFMRRALARVDGRVPIVVGVSNPGIAPLVELARQAMDAGAAGVMITPISTLRTEEQTVGYFEHLCETLGPDVPVVLQDYPQATNVHLSVATIERIIDRCPQVVMLKHEDCPGLAKLTRLRRNATDGLHRRVSILVGNGGLYLPQELARGADGAMTGFAYPEMLVQVCRLFRQGDAEGGEDVFDRYLPLLRHEAQPGIGLALRKEILRRRGAIASAFVRAPGPKLSRDDLEELDRLIARLERRLNASSVPAARVA
jgi:4-hydroxy-tetrahydrodipicolinate synthase